MSDSSPWAKTEAWKEQQSQRVRMWKPWERRWPKVEASTSACAHEALSAALGLPVKAL